LASVGLVQVRKIKAKIESQKRMYSFYKQALKEFGYIRMIKVDMENGELPLWIEVVCDGRKKLINLLEERGVQAKPFYPALSKLPYLYERKPFCNAEFYASCGLILPSGDGQSPKNLERTVEALNDISSYF
jgi:dTDP-4-amino-4,6-dideoxygalactose transaminase